MNSPAKTYPVSPLMNQREAAQFLRVSRWTFTKLGIPVVRVGARSFYRKSDLEAFIDRNTVRES